MVERKKPKAQAFDNTQARNEGWELVWANKRYNVQKFDANTKFLSDDDAGVFVVHQASSSAYHKKAVDLALGTASPEDRELKRRNPG